MRRLCCGHAPAVKGDEATNGQTPTAGCAGRPGKPAAPVDSAADFPRRAAHGSGWAAAAAPFAAATDCNGSIGASKALRKSAGWQSGASAAPDGPGLDQPAVPLAGNEAGAGQRSGQGLGQGPASDALARLSSASSGCRGTAQPLQARVSSCDSFASARSSLPPESPRSPRADAMGLFAGGDAGPLSPRILARHDAAHGAGDGAPCKRAPGSLGDTPRTPRAHAASGSAGSSADADGLLSRVSSVAGALLLDRTPLQEPRGGPAGGPAGALEGAESLEGPLRERARRATQADPVEVGGAGGAAPPPAQGPSAGLHRGDREGVLERGDWLGARRVSGAVRTVGPEQTHSEPVGWVRAGSISRVSRVSLARTLSQHQSSELRAQRGTDLAAYDAAWLAMLNGLAAARGVYPKPSEGLGLLANGGAKVGLEADGGAGARRGSLNGYKAGLGLEKGLATCVADVPLLPLAPWNRKPGHLGHLTAEQEQALSALRARFPESAAFHSDYDLLRFLRARDFDLKAAIKMYNEYCTEYRPGLLTLPLPFLRPALGRAYRLAALAAAGFPERPAEQTARLAPLLRIIHAAAIGTDPDMRPVVYLRPAAMVKSPAQPPLADRLALQSASNEATRLLCALASAAAGYHVEEVVQVIDLAGMSPINMLQHVRREDAQSEWQHNMDYCPETLNKVIIINAPLGAGFVWKAASVFLPPSTRQKINILSRGSSGLAELQRLVGKANVPTCYGGTGERFEWPAAEPVAVPPGAEAPADKAAAALAAVGTAMGHAMSNAVRELESLPSCISRESVRTL